MKSIVSISILWNKSKLILCNGQHEINLCNSRWGAHDATAGESMNLNMFVRVCVPGLYVMDIYNLRIMVSTKAVAPPTLAYIH